MARQFLTQAVITQGSRRWSEKRSRKPRWSVCAKRASSTCVRNNERVGTPLNEHRFEAGDQLLLESPVAGVKGIREMPGVVFAPEAELGVQSTGTREAILMEGIIGSRSTFVGRTLRDLNFRQRYGVLILAVHRQGENLREKFEDVELAFGDTLLVQGPAEGIHRLMQERDFLNLTEPKQRAFRPHKAPVAIGAIVAVMLLAALNVLPIAALALLAAIVVVLTRCLDLEEASRQSSGRFCSSSSACSRSGKRWRQPAPRILSPPG